ncbi:MAG: hypothetical protein JO113_08015, partial [Candidatus Eremiobacteraeota bacterium]|nr:hypothetical protein [Candidatus Eremiobacteraeota bacterium]
AVPIDLKVEKDPQGVRAFHVSFVSANLPGAFPGFNGSMSVEPGGLGESTLSLRGSYDPPMRLFGKFLDAALTPGVAERSLENFIDEIASACEARVNQREAEFVRYRFYARSLR